MPRTLRSSVLLAFVLVSLPTGVRAQEEQGWGLAVDTLLDQRAASVVAKDKPAFEATMRDATEPFVRRTTTWFDRVTALGLTHYDLRRDTDGYLDLAPALVDPYTADEVHVVEVLEEIGLGSSGEEPSMDTLYLTLIRRGERWSVVSDTDVRGLGLQSSRNLWDFDDVTIVNERGVTVLTVGSRSTAVRIARATAAAVARVERAWPLEWDTRVIVVIPGTTAQLARILETTFDLGPFVAFAGSSVDRTDGGYRLRGHRIYIQPGTFFATSTSFQEDTLGHELLHIANRPVAGAFTPAWLDEGVAQIYGERRVPAMPTLRREVRADRFDGRLPADHRFSIGSRDEIHLAYEASASFVEHVGDSFGADAGARLYAALGSISPVSIGNARYHLDRAARQIFKKGMRVLEREWTGQIEKELR